MINSIEFASRSRENVTHTLYLDEKGKAIGCTCDEAKAVHVAKYNWKPCRHMRENNSVEAITTVDVVPHVEDDLRSEYQGCMYCGCNHTSWNCPF